VKNNQIYRRTTDLYGDNSTKQGRVSKWVERLNEEQINADNMNSEKPLTVISAQVKKYIYQHIWDNQSYQH
jgi:hypothetical protein